MSEDNKIQARPFIVGDRVRIRNTDDAIAACVNEEGSALLGGMEGIITQIEPTGCVDEITDLALVLLANNDEVEHSRDWWVPATDLVLELLPALPEKTEGAK